MNTAANSSRKRFVGDFKCPICNGVEDDPRGNGSRCFGYLNGQYIYCTRPDHAGKLEFNPKSSSYRHNAKGPCLCGIEHAPDDSKKEIDHVYEYLDAAGVLRFEVVRFKNPKDFRQRRVENGKRIWGLKGVEPFLYRLPRLSSVDQTETVYIVEGEKDADNLTRAGLVATCNPMGAGKWRDRYSESLRGRSCVILPDNDDTGRDHAQEVASSLQGKAATVMVVELPGLPAKGDVSDFLAAGGTLDQIRELAEKTPEWTPPALPMIFVIHEEFKTNDQAIAALSTDQNIYQRNLKLVTITWDYKAAGKSGINRAEGTPLIRPVLAARLREDLTRVAQWKAFKADRRGETEAVNTHPPNWAVSAILAREDWPGIRYLVGIVESPTIRADGSVIETPGFDPATGLLYVPSGSFPRVPLAPTQDDAKAAADMLFKLVGDFPFKENSRAAWLAALLTPLARFLIDGPCPIFLFDANTSGAGKTLLCDVIAIIVTGRTMTRTGYSHDPVEMDKQITATALAGDRIVLFDNLDNGGRFGNSALDRATTGRTYRGRVLGKSEMTAELDLISVFYASGNNVALCGDVTRRIVPCRLESILERPETRSDFAIKDLLAHVTANRGDLVRAALTILRGYILAGKPDQALTPMDFPAWSGLVRNAVKWATRLDPCEGCKDLAGSNPEREHAAALVEGWYELQTALGVKGMTSAEMIKELKASREDQHVTLRSALADLWPRTKIGELPSSGSIGMKIQSIREQVFGTKRFVSTADEKRAKIWSVVDLQSPGECSESIEPFFHPSRAKNTVIGMETHVNAMANDGKQARQAQQTHPQTASMQSERVVTGADYCVEDWTRFP